MISSNEIIRKDRPEEPWWQKKLKKPEKIRTAYTEVLPTEVPEWVLKGFAYWKGVILVPAESGTHFDVLSHTFAPRASGLISPQESIIASQQYGVRFAAKIAHFKKGEAWIKSAGWQVIVEPIAVETDSPVDLGFFGNLLNPHGMLVGSQQLKGGSLQLDKWLTETGFDLSPNEQ